MTRSTAQPLHPHERVAIQRRRVLGLSLGLAVFCVVGAVIGFCLWNWRQSHRVATILQATASRGEPITGKELNAYFSAPNPEEDASALWIAGLQPLTKPHANAEGVALPFVDGEEPTSDVALGLLSTQVTPAKNHLTRFADSFENFHAAAAKGGRARLPVDFRDGVSTILNYEQAARSAARLLLLDIRHKVSTGDDRGCARSLLTLLLLPRCLEEEPCAVSQNICSAIQIVGVDAMACLLGKIQFTSEDLGSFEKVIAARSEQRRMQRALTGERVMGIAAFEDPEELRNLAGNSYMLITSADLALYLEHIDRVAVAAKLEFPACIAAAQKAQDQLDLESGKGLAALTSALTRSLTPDFKKNFIIHVGYAAAKNRAALTAIAIEGFRRRSNSPPQALKDLVPEFLAAEPIDPFNGKTMIYRVTTQGIFIYSVGDNLVDDAGVQLSGADRGLLMPVK